MSRRWIAGMLCVTMAAGLAAGCGNSEASADTALQSSAVGESGGSSSAGDDGTAGGDYTAADSGSDATTQADGSGNIDWDEDPALVNWYMWGVGVSAPSTEALDRVEEKINAITEPAINVTVNLEMLEMGNYLTQMPMQITAGDKIDLITTFPAGGGSFNTMAASGQLLPLDDLIADYCQEMTAMVPENFFDATTINGTIYGAPIYTDYTNDLYFICKKEIFDETGFDESDFTSYEDLTVLFDKVKELHPEMKVISSGAQSITGSVGGTELTSMKIAEGPVTTSSMALMAMAIPVTATEPEAAARLMNLTYTNAELKNLVNFGIEGEDYTLNEDNAVVITENCTYAPNTNGIFGNVFNSYPTEAEAASGIKLDESVQSSLPYSPLLGFTVDTSTISNEVAALSSIMEEYGKQVECGIADEETYDEMIEKMYDSGLSTYLDEIQRQLDEWLASGN